MKESSTVINSLIQVSGIIGVQYFGIIWAIYPAMFLMVIVIAAQTLSASYIFATEKYPDANDNVPNIISPGTGILISVFYMLTAYQVYLLGFTIFSGIAFAHATILFLNHTIRSLNT